MIKRRSTCVVILPRVENVFTSRSMVETVLSCTAMIPLTRHWLLTSVSASDKRVSGGMTPNTCMTNLYLPPVPGGIKLLVLLCPEGPNLFIAMLTKGISGAFGNRVHLEISVLADMLKKRFLRPTMRSLNALLARPVYSLFCRGGVLTDCRKVNG